MDKKHTPQGYNLVKQLGKGTFGVVYLTIKENNLQLLATKVINLSNLKNKRTLDYLIKEKEIMEELKHPNIIRLDNFIEFNNHYFYIMEYCNGGNLSEILKKYMQKYRKPFPLDIIQYFMRQIVDGLKYIHSKNIIHRDLKLANILVDFKNISRKIKREIIVNFDELDNNDFLNSTIKIIDFGLSTKLGLDQLAKSLVGTPFNMDPLILKKYQQAGGYERVEGYNEKADIWSLGTICYQMLTGDPLFTADTVLDLIKKVEEGNYSIPIDIDISDEITSFLNSMLKYKGDLRPSAEELSHHDFLIKNVKDFTRIDYQKNPEAKDINYIIINAMRNSIVFKKNNPKEIIYLNYINNLYNDYKAVFQYFKENGLHEKEKDAYQKCLQIENIKRQINSGKKINLSSFPNKITPEYIYNCSIEERNKKFKEILSSKRAEKNLLEVKIKNLKKKIISKNIRDEYEKNIINYNKLQYAIQDLEEKSKNIWVPAPIYIKKMQKQAKEIISFDKSEFKIQFTIKRIDNINDNLNLIITFFVNLNYKYEKKVELKAQNSYEEWIWILNAEEWVNTDNNFDNFILEIKIDKFFNDNLEINVDFSKIKNGKEFTFDQQIVDKEIIKKVNISIVPILPEGEKSTIIEEKEILTIEKIYPPFKLITNNDNNSIGKPSLMSFNIKDSKTKP